MPIPLVIIRRLVRLKLEMYTLNDNLIVWYWKRWESGAEFHLKEAHKSFEKIADMMGYDVVRRGEPSVVDTEKAA